MCHADSLRHPGFVWSWRFRCRLIDNASVFFITYNYDVIEHTVIAPIYCYHLCYHHKIVFLTILYIISWKILLFSGWSKQSFSFICKLNSKKGSSHEYLMLFLCVFYKKQHFLGWLLIASEYRFFFWCHVSTATFQLFKVTIDLW